MHLKALVNFSWAHQGVRIEEFEKGDIIETTDEDLIKVATEEGWAEEVDAQKSTITVDQIKAKLNELKIPFPGDAKKADLLKLLPEE